MGEGLLVKFLVWRYVLVYRKGILKYAVCKIYKNNFGKYFWR